MFKVPTIFAIYKEKIDAAAFGFYCYTKHLVMFIVTCFLAKPDCINFPSEQYNAINKQQLCGVYFKLVFFYRLYFLLVSGPVIQIFHPKSHKNAKHSATESPSVLRGAKTSWIPTLAGVSYKFDFVGISIHLQCKISRSLVLSVLFHKILRDNTKTKRIPVFLKIVKIDLAWKAQKV